MKLTQLKEKLAASGQSWVEDFPAGAVKAIVEYRPPPRRPNSLEPGHTGCSNLVTVWGTEQD